ncbi:hypothetical protein VNI00_013518 [Paramarasmius palmivorus]|uniref:Uncharacterized protein n=1 Tax=Paramarasmius palmivorus TaxID=297713 RepID=A0AAW0BY04_9AGAR
MPPSSAYTELKSHLTGLQESWKANTDNEEEKIIPKTLTAICETLRNTASSLSPEELRQIVNEYAEFEHEVVNHAYSTEDDDGYDFVPISCGSANVNDRASQGIPGLNVANRNFMGELLSIMALAAGRNFNADDVLARMGGTSVKPYDPSSNPSPLTTPLARFSATSTPLPSSAPPEAVAFAQARCEITSDSSCSPIDLCLDGRILAELGAGGWKNRDPVLMLYDLEGKSRGNSIGRYISVDVGLAGVAYYLRLDASRKLVWVADGDRVKSYRWSESEDSDKATPAHTLSSKKFSGGFILKDAGSRLLRFGSGGMGIWDVEKLPTHGRNGKKIIGRSMDPENIDSWRDDDGDEIELSSGTKADRTSNAKAFVDAKVVECHPSNANQILATHEKHYGVATVDLQAEDVALRYVGHGAYVNSFATSAADPHGFATAASDGGVRLYDSRTPTPSMAIYHSDEFIQAVLYEHIGGQPYVLYGGTKSEQIKVWDVRSKTALYELSTGNNEVNAMVWDGSTQTLFAGTECSYMDRLGYTHDYARAKFGKIQKRRVRELWGQVQEDDDIDEDDDDDDDDEFEEWAWPRRAAHGEESFGYPLDSGEHRTYRYSFKINPNPKILPEYGQATVGDQSYW